MQQTPSIRAEPWVPKSVSGSTTTIPTTATAPPDTATTTTNGGVPPNTTTNDEEVEGDHNQSHPLDNTNAEEAVSVMTMEEEMLMQQHQQHQQNQFWGGFMQHSSAG